MTTIYWAGNVPIAPETMAACVQKWIRSSFLCIENPREIRIESYVQNNLRVKDFIDEGRLAPIYDRITAGDYLMIQFYQNSTEGLFLERETEGHLHQFANVAHNKGAFPVLIVPDHRKPMADELVKLIWETGTVIADFSDMEEVL